MTNTDVKSRHNVKVVDCDITRDGTLSRELFLIASRDIAKHEEIISPYNNRDSAVKRTMQFIKVRDSRERAGGDGAAVSGAMEAGTGTGAGASTGNGAEAEARADAGVGAVEEAATRSLGGLEVIREEDTGISMNSGDLSGSVSAVEVDGRGEPAAKRQRTINEQ
jgi:hypothetical protein